MTDPVGEVTILSLVEAEAQVRAAEAEALAAQKRLTAARGRFDVAQGVHTDGEALAKLALEGNQVAMRRLHEQVCALHPGIVGYGPTPSPNDDTWWRESMYKLSLLVDFKDDVDDEFLSGLAEAMLAFVRIYKPDRNNNKAKRQGMATAHTRGGTLFYRTKKGHEAHFERPDPAYPVARGTLMSLLAKVPAMNMLAALNDDGGTALFTSYSRYQPNEG